MSYIVIQTWTNSFSYNSYVKCLVLKGIEKYKKVKKFIRKMHV